MNNQERDRSEIEARRLIQEAIRKLGWNIPESAEDVERLEAELADRSIDLPPHLSDPTALLDRERSTIPFSRPGSTESPTDTEENLAQAARFGGEIPDDVKTKMEQDRDAAEREWDEQTEE